VKQYKIAYFHNVNATGWLDRIAQERQGQGGTLNKFVLCATLDGEQNEGQMSDNGVFQVFPRRLLYLIYLLFMN